MTPKPIHATFAISPFLIQSSCTRLLSDAGALVRRVFPQACCCCLPGSGQAWHYRGVAPVCMEVPARSELEGTPMMAAPSRAAAAVTASRAVLKFTGLISVSLDGHRWAHIGFAT